MGCDRRFNERTGDEYVITIICLMVKSILTIWGFLETNNRKRLDGYKCVKY